jgi:hypothetical protein
MAKGFLRLTNVEKDGFEIILHCNQ